jgi:hypothetical protein
MLIGRISSDHKKILTAPKVAMARSSRQHSNISGVHCDFMPAFPAEHQAPLPSRKTQDLVRRGVEMVKIVDAIAPLRRPAVPLKSLLENQGWIGPRGLKGAMIDHNRKALVVGHPSVARELKHLGLRGFCARKCGTIGPNSESGKHSTSPQETRCTDATI